MKKKAIGLTGGIGSGKGVATEYLRTKGYCIYSLSDCVRDELCARKLPITRESQQDMGNDMRRLFGNEFWAEKVIKKVDSSEHLIAFDSIRHPAEIDKINQYFNLYLIGLESTQEERYSRLVGREREGDRISREEFARLDAREIGSGKEASDINLDKCLELADYLIENHADTKELYRELDFILTLLSFGKKK